MFGPRAFETVAFVTGPGASEYVYQCLQSGISVLHSHVILLDVGPTGFQSQTFWGLISSGASPGLRFLMWDIKPLLLREKLSGVIPPSCGPGHSGGHGAFDKTASMALLSLFVEELFS